MAPSTRNLLIGSSLVVVVGLCTGLVAYYGAPASSRDTVMSELAYIPADVSAVGFADVRGIMDSGFRQKLREVMPTGSEKDRLYEETGIDIERDIDTVVAGFSGHDGPAGALVVFRGRFDQNRIEELALTRGAERQSYGGRTLLAGLTPPEGEHLHASTNHVPAIAFLDDDHLALGEVNAVRTAIDTAASNNGVASNAELMQFIASVQDTGNAWLVGRAADISTQPQIPDQVRGQFDGVQWISVSAAVGSDVRGLVRAQTLDDARGEQLRSVVGGAVAAARMFTQQDPRLAAALDSVQATGTGPNVELSFRISPELLDLISQHRDRGEGNLLPPPADN